MLRFVAGFLAAASVMTIGLGGLRLFANICRPEESPEWTAHMIKQSAIMTELGVAVLAVCGGWYLRLLRETTRKPASGATADRPTHSSLGPKPVHEIARRDNRPVQT